MPGPLCTLRTLADERNLPLLTVAKCFLRVAIAEYWRVGSLSEVAKENPEKSARIFASVEACLDGQSERRRPARIM